MKALGQARGLVSLGPDPVNCYHCDLLIFSAKSSLSIASGTSYVKTPCLKEPFHVQVPELSSLYFYTIFFYTM